MLKKVRVALNDKTIRHQLPEVFHGQLLHIIGLFNVIYLAVTAVAGQYQHLSTRQPNLFHLAASVEYPFFVIPRGHRATAATAACLVQLVGVQINPVF